jgi:exopolyphosphatase/pppGpp-phosphohydrolase
MALCLGFYCVFDEPLKEQDDGSTLSCDCRNEWNRHGDCPVIMIVRSSKLKPFRNGNATGIEFEIRSRYASTRAGVPDGLPITVIHIGAAQTAVASGAGAEPATVMMLAIGSQKTSSEFFKHNPPTAEELENAIIVVEDEVTRARTMTAADSILFTFDAAILEVALNSGVSNSLNLIVSRDAIERTFDRFAQVMLGNSASHQGIPASTAFAATLLILREFMHHLQFSSINIKT